MNEITIQPGLLHGSVVAPPSKSQAHRLLLCAALAKGESTICNVSFSQDINATLRCIEALGAAWTRSGEDTLLVTGLAGQGGEMPRMNCGESGSTLRFLIPIALAVAGGGVFTGQGRLMERPLTPYFKLFEEKGILYAQKDGTLTVQGALTAGEYTLPGNVSSQFFTGLMLALPLLSGDSTIRCIGQAESWDYVTLTRAVQRAAGVTVQERAERGEIRLDIPPGTYRPVAQAVEGDWSQAGFWYAAAALGSGVEVGGLDQSSVQGDQRIAQFAKELSQPGDLELDVSQCPDLVPVLAVMAAVRGGATRIVNAARLRLKESDRLSAITAVLNALGARVTEQADGLVISGVAELFGGVEVDCHNDHRIAMMAAIAATRCTAPVRLLGADCVNKSYPSFWEEYRRLGGSFHVHISG